MADAASTTLNVPDYNSQQQGTDSGSENDYNNDLSPYKTLIAQIRNEYEIAYRAQVGRIQILLKRLKLYNNQRRDTDAVGDTTLFDIFQSIFASLYTDQLTTEFVGRTEGSEDTAEALNNTAKFDYDEMQLPMVDYEWDWDTLFFGYGLLGMTYFDRKKMIPVPEVWDPLVTLRDPDAVSVNGNVLNGKGAARYFGREIQIRRFDMEDIPSVFDVDRLKLTRPTRSLIEQARQERENAQGLNNQIRYEEKNLGVNARYPLVEWYTWWKHPEKTNDKPVRVLAWIGNDMQKVCRFKVLKGNSWPIVHRKLFPTAHTWDGVSIPDLVEDKQRMKAVLFNLGIKMMKSDLFGMYLFNKNRIKSKGDLNFDIDKQVPVDLKPGESINDQVAVMPKAAPNLPMFNMIIQALDVSAQRATSTPEMQMGQPTKGHKTLGELNKVDTKSSNRYSLAAKIWQWSEAERWEQWYGLYKEHFKPRIDEKMVRINTVFGPKYKWFGRDDLISEIDPDVFITSKFITDQQRTNDRALMLQYGQVMMQVPGSNMRYFVKRLGKLHNVPKDELDRLLPPTPDELKARYENVALEDDKVVPVDPNDNDEEHLEEHAKGKETPAMLAHIATHQHARELKKQQPQLFPQMQQQQQAQQQQQQGNGSQQVSDQLGKNQKKKFNQPQVTQGGFGMMQQ